jgi:hypothetical protein
MRETAALSEDTKVYGVGFRGTVENEDIEGLDCGVYGSGLRA